MLHENPYPHMLSAPPDARYVLARPASAPLSAPSNTGKLHACAHIDAALPLLHSGFITREELITALGKNGVVEDLDQVSWAWIRWVRGMQ